MRHNRVSESVDCWTAVVWTRPELTRLELTRLDLQPGEPFIALVFPKPFASF
jgi:hypothetical protein